MAFLYATSAAFGLVTGTWIDTLSLCSPDNKKKNTDGNGVSYEPWEVMDFPKGPAESIREDVQRHRDAVDRSAKMTKPPGATGTTGATGASR